MTSIFHRARNEAFDLSTQGWCSGGRKLWVGFQSAGSIYRT